jgi:hypothetical protein
MLSDVMGNGHALDLGKHREPKSLDDPWIELNKEFGHTMRQFQNAARDELRVGGPTHPWDLSDVRSYPERGSELQALAQAQQAPGAER